MDAATLTVDNKVKRVVSNLRNLPTPPIVFHQIQRVINDARVSARQIAAILAEDPAMSVKVLKLTNSAFYGLPREVSSVKQAVAIVGMEAIKNLVLSAAVLDMFKGKNIDQEFQESFWRHSLATGSCCRLLAQRVRSRGVIDPDSAFSCGLLHDIGKMVISCFLSEEHLQLKRERETDRTSADWEIEERTLGYNHAEIGGYLATHWKLPGQVGITTAFHHYPQRSGGADPLVYIVHLADYVAKRTFYNEADAHLIGSPRPEVMDYLRLSERDLEAYGGSLHEEYTKAQTFMQMAGIK